jgi:hypothetical protein
VVLETTEIMAPAKPRALECTHLHVAGALYLAETSLHAIEASFGLAAALASIAALFALLAIASTPDVSTCGVG